MSKQLFQIEIKPVEASPPKQPSKLPGTVAAGITLGIGLFMIYGEQINRAFSPYHQQRQEVHAKQQS